MQLLLLLLLAIAGGDEEALKDVRPMLKNMGGGDTLRAIENAERIAAALAASGNGGQRGNKADGSRAARERRGQEGRDSAAVGGCDFYECFPLSPVRSIADGEILERLSRYIALG